MNNANSKPYTPLELKELLGKSYDVLDLVDLATIHNSYTSAFKYFKSVHRAEFFNNQRLVFYSSFKPSQEFLDHLQHAAAEIDISNFFILVCCPYDITDSLNLANQKHGHDDSFIQSLKINLLETNKLDIVPQFDWSTMCVTPFMHLHVSIDQTVKPCCINKRKLSNFGSDTNLVKIMHSDPLVKLRTQLASGEKPEECNACWQTEAHGKQSSRLIGLELWRKQFEQEWADDVQLRSVDLATNNTCNFKCRICNAQNSSLFLEEQLRNETNVVKIQKLQKIKQSNQLLESSQSLQDHMLSLLPNIVNLDFFGGEPFAIKSLNKFLHKAASTTFAKNIRLHFNTNGSIFPTDLVTNVFSEFKTVEILFSIDNVGKRFEVERGSQWLHVYNNLKKFKELESDRFVFVIYPTISIQNILYLDDVLALANEFNFRVVFNNHLTEPAGLSIKNLSKYAKMLIIEKYANHWYPELGALAESINSDLTNYGDKNLFFEYTAQLDRQRGENFRDSHCEIFDAMLQ